MAAIAVALVAKVSMTVRTVAYRVAIAMTLYTYLCLHRYLSVGCRAVLAYPLLSWAMWRREFMTLVAEVTFRNTVYALMRKLGRLHARRLRMALVAQRPVRKGELGVTALFPSRGVGHFQPVTPYALSLPHRGWMTATTIRQRLHINSQEPPACGAYIGIGLVWMTEGARSARFLAVMAVDTLIHAHTIGFVYKRVRCACMATGAGLTDSEKLFMADADIKALYRFFWDVPVAA